MVCFYSLVFVIVLAPGVFFPCIIFDCVLVIIFKKYFMIIICSLGL